MVALPAALACVVACGGQAQMTAGTSAPATSTSFGASPAAPPSIAPSPSPQVELREANVAVVAGQKVAFDGVAEGLDWPGLLKALGRKPGDGGTVVVQVAREVPFVNVLRAVFMMRFADVRLQTPDERGAMYAVELKAKTDARDPTRRCHLAVFLKPGGALRVASAAGPQEQPSSESFARALDAARNECALRYVAFGAESNDVPWGAVFDVIVTVDRAKAAGGARYVLADVVHPAK